MRATRAALVLSIAAAACGPDAPAREHAPAAAAAPAALPSASRVDTLVGTVRVAVADTLLTLSRDGVRTEASLQEYINSSGGYAHRLLDARRSGEGGLYLLIRTSGMSRPETPNAHCGAGDETNVTWLQVDSALRVVKGQTVLVASCLRSHEPVRGSDELTGDPLSIAFHIRGDSIATASYDRRFPERGLRVAAVPDTATR